MPPKRKTSSKKDTVSAKKGKTSEAKDTDPVLKGKPPTSLGGNFSLSAMLTDSSWKQALESEMEKDNFRSLEEKLASDYSSKSSATFPPKGLIFNAFNLTPLNKVKVVLLGQDPYHDDNQAHGLAFSVPKGIKIPPSLRNMYKELEDDLPGFTTPDHGCLEKWATEGVLLLNATLTVQAHTPNSHKAYGWQTFTDEVIRTVSDRCHKVVFLLWGNFAHKKEKLIDAKKHVVLKDAHPSPLSFGKFHHCKCFSRANEALKKNGISPVDWNL